MDLFFQELLSSLSGGPGKGGVSSSYLSPAEEGWGLWVTFLYLGEWCTKLVSPQTWLQREAAQFRARDFSLKWKGLTVGLK